MVPRYGTGQDVDATAHMPAADTSPLAETAPWHVDPTLAPDRPQWARLPEPRTQPRSRPRVQRPPVEDDDEPTGGGFNRLKERVLGNPRGRLTLAAVLAVIGLLVAVGGWWLGVGRFTTAPNLVAFQKSQAITLARQSGLTVRFDAGRFDEKVPKDTVVAQDPAAGRRIVGGSTITLSLSLGPERYQVPDEAGKDATLAQNELTQLKLVVQVTQVYDDVVPVGMVVGTDPASPTTVKPNTKVLLKVSRGRAPITVPSVIGEPLDQAQSELTGQGLKTTVKQQESDKPANTVLAQDPIDGTGVEAGATVTLTVSKGPAAVAVPSLVNHSAEEARQLLAQVGLQVQILGAGTVRVQNPPAGQQVPPGTTVVVWCFG
jgi:serine/threonine-protein kinase